MNEAAPHNITNGFITIDRALIRVAMAYRRLRDCKNSDDERGAQKGLEASAKCLHDELEKLNELKDFDNEYRKYWNQF
ncbi:hypothetical protein HBA92_17400 [Ochrobactrum sp. MR28]|nr:hypothetical protein [Ochrobactrum sp. MR28]MBX8817994.1 hypothetical protein [Ochrobactrum sp. MR31]